MALLRPALNQLGQLTRPLNESEAAIAQQLARLDDGWTVYIQPRIALDQPDFVVVHDLLGVCVIEVRDCSPGGSLPPGDDPRFTATRTRSVLYDQFFALPSDGTQVTTAVRTAVIMPRCTDAQAAELLGTSNAEGDEREVEVWGADSVRHQLLRIAQGTGCAHPLPDSIARLRASLVASEVLGERPAPSPRSTAAFEIEVNKQGDTIRRVRGTAGSGKSFGLAARAAHLAAQGKRVLLLSFNVTLANHLRTMVADRCAEYGANPTLVTCTNFHSLCTRIVQDAEQAGVAPTAPRGARWTTAIVTKAADVLESGNVATYDAVLIDEGQDFELAWWNLLHDHLLTPGGEMLLVVDPTQDIYGRTAWHAEDSMTAAGFDSPWLNLGGSYRMPADLVSVMKNLSLEPSAGGGAELSTPSDLTDVAGPSHGSLRLWRTVDAVGDIGVNVGREVVRLLKQHPSLHPSDVAFVCEYQHDGVAAVREIEAAGYEVHHIFSRDPDDARRRRKYRFDPDARAITGSTIHSLKGWQTTALVVGIGVEANSKRLAYTALTRVSRDPLRPAVVSVISADKQLNEFGDAFAGLPVRPEGTTAPPPPPPAPPTPAPAGLTAAPVATASVPAAVGGSVGLTGSTVTADVPSAPIAPLAEPVPAAAAAAPRFFPQQPDQQVDLPNVIPMPPLASKPLVGPTPNAPAVSARSATPPPPPAPMAPAAPVAPPAPVTPAAPVAPAADRIASPPPSHPIAPATGSVPPPPGLDAAPQSPRPAPAPPMPAPPMSAPPISAAPMSAAPMSAPPISAAPISAAPMSAAPISAAPMSAAPISAAPMSAPPSWGTLGPGND